MRPPRRGAILGPDLAKEPPLTATPAPSARARLPLHLRFAAAGGAVMLAGMLILGSWINARIEEDVTRNSAIATALYMESFIAPLTQELSANDAVSPETGARLSRLFREPHLAERIAGVKIWKPGGLIAWSTDPALIGARFAPTDALKAAWSGEVSADFEEASESDDLSAPASDLPLLEVYNPIHSVATGAVIAVAEFYQIAEELERDLLAAQLMTWGVVASVCLGMFALLFGIVLRGARTIDRQHAELELRLADVARVSEQNAALSLRVQRASMRGAELNERHLRRISAELHDGPAQALAHASLRLDALFRKAPDAAPQERDEIRDSLNEAMREMREISRGLSLPQIEGKPLREVIAMVARAHERRTGSDVVIDLKCDGRKPDHSTAIAIYRFVQEGLSNAFRHGGGIGQRVACEVAGDALTIAVSDDGPGFDPTAPSPGLGLPGLRERVESAGGAFTLDTAPGAGTRLSMTLTLGG